MAPGFMLASALLVALIAFLNLRDPGIPAGGLDPSWVIATEAATRKGAAFGREYVFTYGPYAHLATRLFHPATHGAVMVYDLLLVLMLCAPALLNRALWPLASILALTLVNGPGGDPAVMAGFLAVALAAMLKRDWRTLLLAAACGPLVLSKLSYLLVLAPLMVLVDARYLLARRIPAFTPTILCATAAAFLMAGQKPADAPTFVLSSLDIILGYGRAMQFEGSNLETALALLLMALILAGALASVAARSRAGREVADRWADVASLLGLCWFLFIAFKAGFVRQDAHTAFTFDALPLGMMVYGGYLGQKWAPSNRLLRPAVIGVAILVLSAAYGLKSYAVRSDVDQGRLPATITHLTSTASALPERISIARQWVSGQRWSLMVERRAAALSSMRREFPPVVRGAVDALPYELAEIIASGLHYRGRPVIQSYSSYTPRLQALDAAHVAGPHAADTLFFKLLDIDGRLPSLATGPSLPIIAGRYDVVGTDPLGLILRKRATPRGVSEHRLAEAPLKLNQWTEVPPGEGLVMAAIDLPASLAGRAMGFLFREPVLRIHLRTAKGEVRVHRFVPGMAQAGFAVSPLPVEGALTVLPLLDASWAGRGETVAALMIEGPEWAFDPGALRFTRVDLQTGFAQGVGVGAHVIAELLASEPKALPEGREIFAHAPLTMSAVTPVSMRVEGRFGLRLHPPGPPDDGAGFVVASVDAAGRETVLFRQVVSPGGPENGFSVMAPAGGRLILRTETLANSNFDWSYWKDLRLTPAG